MTLPRPVSSFVFWVTLPLVLVCVLLCLLGLVIGLAEEYLEG